MRGLFRFPDYYHIRKAVQHIKQIKTTNKQLLTINHSAMPAMKGSYNKASKSPPLSEQQLETLNSKFKERSHDIPCPHCKKPTTFHFKGKCATTGHTSEPEFKCAACNRIMHAYAMYLIVTNTTSDMEEDSFPPSTSDTQTSETQPLENSNPTAESQITEAPDLQTLFQMVKSLTIELQQARMEITRLHEELRGNNKQEPAIASTTAASATNNHMEEEFPTLPTTSAPWRHPEKVMALKHSLSRAKEKRMESAARFFHQPSPNQGFQYMYLPTKARVPLGKLRTTFKQLGINNGRLLDLHYPDRNIVAVLVHNDYAPEFKELIIKRGIKINTDFDPRSGSILKDPKYANESPEKRDEIAQEIHDAHLNKALTFIRGPAKLAVARFFASKNWITQEYLQEILYYDQNMTSPNAIFDMNTDDSVNTDIEMVCVDEDDSHSTHSNHSESSQ